MSRRKRDTPHLTAEYVRTATYRYPKGSRRADYRPDGKLERFNLRLLPSGAKRYVVRATVNGKLREVVVGDANVLPLKAARALGAEMLVEMDAGKRPRPRGKKRDVSLTLAEYFPLYLSRHTGSDRWKREIARLASRHLLPRFGASDLSEITTGELRDLHAKLRATPFEANRVRDLMSAIINAAIEDEELPAGHRNPARVVKRYKEKPRRRVFSHDNLRALLDAISEVESEQARVFFTTLMVIPLRVGELQRAQWTDLDATRRVLTVQPRSPDKDASPHPLPRTIVERITALPRVDGNPYIFTSRDGTTHLKEVQSTWELIRDRAGVEDARLHDLRRTLATAYAASTGGNHFLVAKFLGHASTAMSKHYVHLATTADENRDFVESWAQALDVNSSSDEPSAA